MSTAATKRGRVRPLRRRGSHARRPTDDGSSATGPGPRPALPASPTSAIRPAATIGRYGRKDGLRSLYGTPDPDERPRRLERSATIAGPAGIFAWLISETVDLSATASSTATVVDPGGTPRGLLVPDPLCRLRRRRPTPIYLVSVQLDYESRPDPFSDRRPGFDLRTTQRSDTHRDQHPCRRTDAGEERSSSPTPIRTAYLRATRVSLLTKITIIGHDGENSETTPPLELGYTDWQPDQRRFRLLSGELPVTSLGTPGLDLVDLFGDGRPCILNSMGSRAYWRNRGDGTSTRRELWPRPRRSCARRSGRAVGRHGR